jgi:2-polyprenyl-3-methyl-5-hydroxy-6-metoxy-1,4-benzoquinol methylase
VIAYAACVGSPEKFQKICLPGLQRVVQPDDLVIKTEHERSIFAAYNEVLDAVRDRDDLEALVLLHEDTEVTDPGFPSLVRRHVADDDVAVVGTVGARAISGLSWWEGDCYGRVSETRGVIDFGGGTHDVETVDGLVMALSPWAVRHLRFDEDAYEGFDAYDADFCAQARAAGKRVVVTELPVVHRHTRVGSERASSDGGSFERNERVFREKWLGIPRPAEVGTGATGVRDEAGDQSYFEHTRPELRALVPIGARRVLDVGCGGGALGAALKAERPGCEVIGLEGFPEAAARARARLDDVLCLDLDSLEELPPDAGKFDAMVFGDVLEHLLDPVRLLRTLLPALADDGVLVLSIPNVKHWTVLFPLLVKDRWTYEDAGLLDRTHVHLFTCATAAEMLSGLGLEVVHVGVNDLAPLPPQMEPLAALAAALGGDRTEAAARLGAYQYLLVARPGAAAAATLAAPMTDSLEPAHELERVRDPEALLREKLASFGPDDVVELTVRNVKHWSVVHPLLAHDRWSAGPDQLRFFTLDELGDLLEKVGLEGVEVKTNDRPLPDELMPLVDVAVAYGAEREETELRLGAYEYTVAARRK